jgi:ankyrin repeat domain-containing protein 50
VKRLLIAGALEAFTKSYFSSTIIQETKLLVEADPTRVLAYFYFDFRDKEKQNVPSFLHSLIAQISNASPILPDEIKALYYQSKVQKLPSDIQALMRILKSILSNQEQVYIIVDALDECLEREDLLEVLSEIADLKSKKLHILVTSRQERDIVEGLEAIVTQSFSLGGSKIDKDIAVHVHSQVVGHPKLRKWPDTVKADIEEKLVAKAQGM